jgi:hypothetical protein
MAENRYCGGCCREDLGVGDFTEEELQGVLNDSVPSSQAAGLVKDPIGPDSGIVMRF